MANISYECLWYIEKNGNDYFWEDFKTRKGAIAFYNKHKNDSDKFDWWVTKRDEDGMVIEDIVI